MSKKRSLYAQLVDLTYVDQQYHREHPQLLHRHHDVLELLYFSHGEGQYYVADRAYPVRHGSMVICNAQVKHGELSGWKNDLESYCCVHQGIALPGLPPNTIAKRTDPPVIYFMAEQAMLEHIIFALYERFRRTGVEDDVCQMLGNAVLNLVYGRLSSEKALEHTGSQNGALVTEIIAYLDNHLHEPLKLNEVADHFYISISHLSHEIKKATGISPMRYILVRRIGEAQTLLMNTSKSIGEISECLGFEDNTYFSRSFKKLVGITPTEYRKYFRRRHEDG